MPQNTSRKMMKGQLEVVVVIGLIIVGVLVVFLATQQGAAPPSSTAPQNIQEQQSMVEDFVINSLRASAVNTTRALEKHGGYIDPNAEIGQELVAQFLFQDVAEWQTCTEANPPKLKDSDRDADFGGDIHFISSKSIEKRFKEAIADFIMNGGVIDDTMDFSGKQVRFERQTIDIDTDIDVNILDTEIEVTVNIPTYIENFRLPGPYTFTIPTRFGRIYKFARDFVIESSKKRFFESFARVSIEFTTVERSGSQYSILKDVWDDCSVPLHISGPELDSSLTSAIPLSLNINMWTAGGTTPSGFPINKNIEYVNGMKYEDIKNEDIKFHLDDNFRSTGIRGSQSINIQNSPAGLLGCLPQDYSNAFEIAYPVIVRVYDQDMETYFSFASMVHLDSITVLSGVDDINTFIQDALDAVNNAGGIDFTSIMEVDLNGNQIQPAPYNSDILNQFDSQDNVFWKDSGNGIPDSGDVMWFDTKDDNKLNVTYEGDILIVGSSADGITGAELTPGMGNLLYEDLNNNGKYNPSPRERIFIDSASQIYNEFNADISNINTNIQSTGAIIQSTLDSQTVMVAGDCGHGSP